MVWKRQNSKAFYRKHPDFPKPSFFPWENQGSTASSSSLGSQTAKAAPAAPPFARPPEYPPPGNEAAAAAAAPTSTAPAAEEDDDDDEEEWGPQHWEAWLSYKKLRRSYAEDGGFATLTSIQSQIVAVDNMNKGLIANCQSFCDQLKATQAKLAEAEQKLESLKATAAADLQVAKESLLQATSTIETLQQQKAFFI